MPTKAKPKRAVPRPYPGQVPPVADVPVTPLQPQIDAENVWASSEVGKLEDITVPSGQRCQCRRPGLEGLMRAGILKDLDELTAIVDTKHIQRVKGRPVADADMLAAIASDPTKIDKMIELVDAVVCNIVVQPHVEPTPKKAKEGDSEPIRLPVVIYADMIDLEDKMFLFNYAMGGTRALATFHEQRLAIMGDMDDESGLEEEAE